MTTDWILIRKIAPVQFSHREFQPFATGSGQPASTEQNSLRFDGSRESSGKAGRISALVSSGESGFAGGSVTELLKPLKRKWSMTFTGIGGSTCP